MGEVRITTPLTDEVIEKLGIGQQVLITGTIYTARDAAHKKLIDLIDSNQELPIDLEGQIIYYVGPSPAPPGKIIGSAGPTTSGRMDAYAPALFEKGLKGVIGKGLRSAQVVESIVKNKAIYLAAVGGAAALISKCIKKADVIAYPELGPEAIHRLEVEDFPAIVVNDVVGRDLYKEGTKIYKVTQ